MRGKRREKRLRAKRFEQEIVKACQNICTDLERSTDPESEVFQNLKKRIGKFVKRLIDVKLLREQDFYIGDWVISTKDACMEPAEIVEINYQLKTARIRDKNEGDIWVKFTDLVKDEDYFLF